MKVSGFSKHEQSEKIDWIARHFCPSVQGMADALEAFKHPDAEVQRTLEGFSENTLSNFPMPYGVAPNFLINDRWYCVPMVIEESSVVAAASAAAKFWCTRGGIKTRVASMTKVGQLHFVWHGRPEVLRQHLPEIVARLHRDTDDITHNMRKRGGGILDIQLKDFTAQEPGLYQLFCTFDTRDSMGANFINSCLEQFGQSLKRYLAEAEGLQDGEREAEVVMAILSNYTPDCMVHAEVSCPVSELGRFGDLDAEAFAEKFRRAIHIAEIDPYRATTHNKGIFNGVDAVVLATGNDFRAIEACGHTHAARGGQYRSLTHCTVEEGVFRFWLELPLAVGTVGGLTKLHPLAKLSLDILGNPDAEELMQIIAATGLAQNFAAVRSLTTTGIQQGHMKMHLTNILNQLQATPDELPVAQAYFDERTVSFNAVRTFLDAHRRRVATVGQ